MIFYHFLKICRGLAAQWCPYNIFSAKRKIFKLFAPVYIIYPSFDYTYYYIKVAPFLFFISPSLQYYIQYTAEYSLQKSLLRISTLHHITYIYLYITICYYLRPFSPSPSRNIFSHFSLVLYLLYSSAFFPRSIIPISSS